MPYVTERWLNPQPLTKPGKDAVRLDDGTYCWADHNTNNFDKDKWELCDLRKKPYVDWELLEVVHIMGPPDIIGPTLVGMNNLQNYYVGHDESELDMENDFYDEPTQYIRTESTESAPKNNDGRSKCYKCGHLVHNSGGGMYQICKNPNCEWFDR